MNPFSPLPSKLLPQATYNLAIYYFTAAVLLVGPCEFFFNAPFGRFAPQNRHSVFVLDGIKAWMAMEIVSPLSFLFFLSCAPLSSYTSSLLSPFQSLSPRRLLLASLYLVHYANRAVISPLRSPGRAPSHVLVPLMGAAFNVVNGGLMATWLASPAGAAHIDGATGWTRWMFWPAVALWAVGFVGNVVHDEVLLDLRRQHQKKNQIADEKEGRKKEREHYGIPTGYLYRFISFPNYLCEWLEWIGFAIAAAPFPLAAISSQLKPLDYLHLLAKDPLFFNFPHDALPAGLGPFGLTPPWMFVVNEVAVMLPRAVQGHLWYKKKFGDTYPKDRKVVIPWFI